MHPGIHAHFAQAEGLVTRDQLLDLGISPAHINALVRDGALVRIRRGVYADPVTWAALDEFRGRPLLQARAAVLRMRRGWVLSHDSSAHALRMDILAPDEPFVHVTRPGFTNAWTKGGVKHHLARFSPSQVTEIGGLRALDPARTAVDIARERGPRDGLAACDSAMRMGCSRARLWEAVAPMTHWRGAPAARTSIELADPGAQTVGESLARELVHELGIGWPDTQFPVQTDRGVAWCDIRVGNHIFEFDGRVKFRRVENGGVAVGNLEAVLWDEKQRQQLICSEGLGMSRIIWADFWGDARGLARRRMRAEYAVTLQRFGPDLPERLARNAREIRGRQGA